MKETNFGNPATKKIDNAFDKICIDKKFKEDNAENFEDKPDITPVDFFAVPLELVENKENFLQWFEPRFFKLRDADGKDDKGGLQEFSQNLKDAVEFLKNNPYILSPRVGKGFSLSEKVTSKVRSGFNNVEDVISFFKKVAIENVPKNTKKFVTPDRNSITGAERLTHCRILTLAYIAEKIKQSHELKEFLEQASKILGKNINKELEVESGILSNLNIPEKLEILSDEETETLKIFEWVEREQKVKGVHFNNIGQEGKTKSYYIPEVHIGIKEGLRTFFKYARDPKEAFKIVDDLLRFRFIFEDNMETEKMLELMHDIQEEAKKKKETMIIIEFKEKNYLTEEILDEYFPEKNDKGDKRKGILNSITIDNNPASGKGYKNMSAKFMLHNPGSTECYFAFEIIFVRRSEHRENERLERSASHFLMEMRQSAELASRINGKLMEDEVVLILREYLEKNIKTEEMPSVLIGEARQAQKDGSANFEMDFTGSMQKKAKILFDFLVADGTLKHVAADFPTIKKPSSEDKNNSGWYMVGRNKDRMRNVFEGGK